MNNLKAGMKITNEVLNPSELVKFFGIKQEEATDLVKFMDERITPALEKMPEQDEIQFSVGNYSEIVNAGKDAPFFPAIIVKYLRKDNKSPMTTNFIFKPFESKSFADFCVSISSQMNRIINDLQSCIKGSRGSK